MGGAGGWLPWLLARCRARTSYSRAARLNGRSVLRVAAALRADYQLDREQRRPSAAASTRARRGRGSRSAPASPPLGRLIAKYARMGHEHVPHQWLLVEISKADFDESRDQILATIASRFDREMLSRAVEVCFRLERAKHRNDGIIALVEWLDADLARRTLDIAASQEESLSGAAVIALAGRLPDEERDRRVADILSKNVRFRRHADTVVAAARYLDVDALSREMT
jgi:hypothetical protein